MTLADHKTLIEQHFSDNTPSAIGVAVSGGSDSLALLLLTVEWASGKDIPVHAATVDHGLRPEAKVEAEYVAGVCAELGVPHRVLHWHGWNRQGNLQAEARKARYRLLAEWAQVLEVDEVLIGHTRDDLAETFLIRLGRKSGVEGLAAMRAQFVWEGQRFARPLLGVTREGLRDHLRAREIRWCEDASNADPSYDRVRAREALRHLETLGLSSETLALVSQNMASARDALDHYTRDCARVCCEVDRGDVVIEAEYFRKLPDEITHRLLGAALQWISGAAYAPRSDSIAKLRAELAGGRSMALSGCLASVSGKLFRLTREAAAVRGIVADGPEWDRWQIDGPWKVGMQIRAVSARDLNELPDWRATGLPRTTLLASPALWFGGNLIAAPLAGFAQGFTANLLPNRANLPVLGK